MIITRSPNSKALASTVSYEEWVRQGYIDIEVRRRERQLEEFRCGDCGRGHCEGDCPPHTRRMDCGRCGRSALGCADCGLPKKIG